MPLPSTIAGIIGAILGIRRKELRDFIYDVNLYCGAELISYDGYVKELARIFKFPKGKISEIVRKLKDPKTARELQPIYESVSLYEPEYKIAVALRDKEIYDDLLRRLRELDFVFDIFGGNDYNFVKNIWDIKKARFIRSHVGRGYCLSKYFKSIRSGNKVIIVSDMVLANVKEKFIFTYGGDVFLKTEKEVVDDGESRIFVHLAEYFLISELF